MTDKKIKPEKFIDHMILLVFVCNFLPYATIDSIILSWLTRWKFASTHDPGCKDIKQKIDRAQSHSPLLFSFLILCRFSWSVRFTNGLRFMGNYLHALNNYSVQSWLNFESMTKLFVRLYWSSVVHPLLKLMVHCTIIHNEIQSILFRIANLRCFPQKAKQWSNPC